MSGHEQSFRNELPHGRDPHGPQRLNVAGYEVAAVARASSRLGAGLRRTSTHRVRT